MSMDDRMPFNDTPDGWKKAANKTAEAVINCPILKYGKHTGKRLCDVDIGYQVWLLEKMTRARDFEDAEDETGMLAWLEVNVSKEAIKNCNELLIDGVACMPFGKYRTVPMKDLPKDYVVWLLGSLQASDNERTIRPQGKRVLDWLNTNIKVGDLVPDPVTDTTELWFGKNKGYTMGEVDDEYFTWMHGIMKDDYSSGKLIGSRLELYKYICNRIGEEME